MEKEVCENLKHASKCFFFGIEHDFLTVKVFQNHRTMRLSNTNERGENKCEKFIFAFVIRHNNLSMRNIKAKNISLLCISRHSFTDVILSFTKTFRPRKLTFTL